jgi:dihydroorotate dehydrogenase
LVHRELQQTHQKHVPLLVKIAPDMDDEEIQTISRRLLEFEIDGVIVSNTTVSRSALLGEKHSAEKGGLSGDPLRNQSNHVLAMVASEVKPKLAVIGVGGIMLPEHAAQKIELGADLVQLYSGFIYSGPDLIAESSEAIRKMWV